jgi:hypothetical protein
MSAKEACCWPEASWKSPKLSSVPDGMAAGSIVKEAVSPSFGWRVDSPAGWTDQTREKPARSRAAASSTSPVLAATALRHGSQLAWKNSANPGSPNLL